MSVKNNSPTAFFSHIFIPIFRIHMVFAERTIEIVELNTIQG